MATSILGRIQSKLRRDARISLDRTFLYQRSEAPAQRACANDNLELRPLLPSELSQVAALGPFDLDEGARRFERGDACFGVWIDGALVHYSWVQTSGTHTISSAGIEVSIGDGDLWIYNCRTSEAHRGRGIYTRALHHIASTALLDGATSVSIYAAESNVASQRGIERAGFRLVSTLRALRLGPSVRALPAAS